MLVATDCGNDMSVNVQGYILSNEIKDFLYAIFVVYIIIYAK